MCIPSCWEQGMPSRYEFDGVTPRNPLSGLDEIARGALRSYVYLLSTPNGLAFYVGRGGGTKAQGNERVLDHFNEAARCLKNRQEPPNDKVRTILETWKLKKPVEWHVVRYGLQPAEAVHVEGALIDVLRLKKRPALTNAVRGGGTQPSGILSAIDVRLLNAPAVNPAAPYPLVYVFEIGTALQGRAPYEAVRKTWPRHTSMSTVSIASPAIAVGLKNQISRVVCRVDRWSDPRGDGGMEFDGAVVDPHELLARNFKNVIGTSSGYWGWGNYLVVSFDGAGTFRVKRGSNQGVPHPC
jgi:hypothetical protein